MNDCDFKIDHSDANLEIRFNEKRENFESKNHDF
jgi:hypothetical protein